MIISGVRVWACPTDGFDHPARQEQRRMITFVAILSAATCVTMFALGFGLLIPLSGAVSALADLMGVACAMVVLGLLFG